MKRQRVNWNGSLWLFLAASCLVLYVPALLVEHSPDGNAVEKFVLYPALASIVLVALQTWDEPNGFIYLLLLSISYCLAMISAFVTYRATAKVEPSTRIHLRAGLLVVLAFVSALQGALAHMIIHAMNGVMHS